MSLAAESDVRLLDARDAGAFRRGHIPGATSLPVDDFNDRWPGILDATPAGQPVITYCSGPGCDMSYELALRLLEEGIVQVYEFSGGMATWREQEMPVETGPEQQRTTPGKGPG